jgi:hypothetical protein
MLSRFGDSWSFFMHGTRLPRQQRSALVLGGRIRIRLLATADVRHDPPRFTRCSATNGPRPGGRDSATKDPMLNFKQKSFIGLAALLSLAEIQGCSSDAATPLPAEGGRTNFAGAPAGGAPVGGAPAGGITAGASAGGLVGGVGGATGGGATGGTGGATGGTGGATGGTGGATGGTGGATGGEASGGTAAAGVGGGTSGSGGTGGATVTFSQIATIFNMNCAVGGCHSGGNDKNLNYQSSTPGLYSVLTTMIPAGTAHCVGEKPVKPGNATDSLLYKVIMGGASCINGNGTEQVVRMPDKCGTNGKSCLTATQVETIKDWINQGAQHQ